MYRGGRATFRGWRRNLALIFGGSPSVVTPVASAAIVSIALLASLAVREQWLPLALAWSAGVAASAISSFTVAGDG